MFSASSLLCIVTLALAINAEPILRRVDTPLITFQSAKRISTNGTINLLARDQARAKFLTAKSGNPLAFKNAGIVSSIPATNQAVDYTITVSGVNVACFDFILNRGNPRFRSGIPQQTVRIHSCEHKCR